MTLHFMRKCEYLLTKVDVRGAEEVSAGAVLGGNVVGSLGVVLGAMVVEGMRVVLEGACRRYTLHQLAFESATGLTHHVRMRTSMLVLCLAAHQDGAGRWHGAGVRRGADGCNGSWRRKTYPLNVKIFLNQGRRYLRRGHVHQIQDGFSQASGDGDLRPQDAGHFCHLWSKTGHRMHAMLILLQDVSQDKGISCKRIQSAHDDAPNVDAEALLLAVAEASAEQSGCSPRPDSCILAGRHACETMARTLTCGVSTVLPCKSPVAVHSAQPEATVLGTDKVRVSDRVTWGGTI